MVLEDATAVLHCAGPFTRTAAPMVEACLRTGTHYLDITGEIDVFEAAHDRDSDAEEAGVMLLPGTGFDVVPTDCLAAHLHERLPDATELELAFEADLGVSPGTAKTAVERNSARAGRSAVTAVSSESRPPTRPGGSTSAGDGRPPRGGHPLGRRLDGLPHDRDSERHRLHVDAAVGGALAAGGGLSRPCSGSTR